MLQPGGAFVQISDLKGETFPLEELPCAAPPYAAIKNLIRTVPCPVQRASQKPLFADFRGGVTCLFRTQFFPQTRLFSRVFLAFWGREMGAV